MRYTIIIIEKSQFSNPMVELLGIIYTEFHDRREMEDSRW